MEKHGGVLYCPVCPGEIGSSFTDVDILRSNFMVSNLLQGIDLKEGVSSTKCESCEENVLASSRCFECSDFLCDNCVEAHRRVRFTKQHRIVSLKNLSAGSLTRAPGCPLHMHEAMKMFCKQCKEPVCRSCILDKHDDHVLVSLKEAMDDAKPKLNTLLVATRANIPILQRKLKEVHSTQEKLEGKVDEVIKEIQATSARILMAVKRREKDLYRMLRRIHDKKSDQLEGRQVALQNELAQVLDSCEFTEQLVEQQNEVLVLHVSELTCARLRTLGGKNIEPIPEVHEDEIKYTVDEKPILDQIKTYGKVTSREDKGKKKEEKANETSKEKRGKNNNVKEEGKEEHANEKQDDETKKEITTKEGEDKKTATVQRRGSWLETLANPRALLRRLSFGGDESNEKKAENSQEKKGDDVSQFEKPKEEKTKKEVDEQYSSPSTKRMQHSLTQPDETTNDPTAVKETTDESKVPSTKGDESKVPSTKGDEPKVPSTKGDEQPSKSTDDEVDAEAGYEIPTSNSILKHQSPHNRDKEEHVQTNSSSQAWTLPGSSRPSGAHSLSYLPTLNILTKNRRGRPREVEIQLESPDNSIVSAQILDHKNGTYTIFYCPLTPGEHNLYVSVGGKNIKHGKKVLNFYGKFGGMGAEELFLTRRALSCIRWQVTPGFVEIKDKKITANPNI